MINLSAARVVRVCTHQVGNRLRDEDLLLADHPSALEPEAADVFLQYLLSAFNPVETYQFGHPTSIALNEVYAVTGQLFAAGADDEAAFVSISQDIARLLYEQAMHPKIRAGKLNVVWFEDVLIEDEAFAAVGIFKSESEAPFLQMRDEGAITHIHAERGFEIKGMDKGCIIVQTEAEDGYRCLVVDKRGTETRYWVDDFLKVRPLSTSYNQTATAMTATRNFLARTLPQEFEVEKSEQINLLNKSAEFFGKKETFKQAEFEEEVLQDDRLIESFRNFQESLVADPHATPFGDGFEISSAAYKKQSKIFKSVLKLDRNFHVYIHGDKDLIERGVDAGGRKFYKLYYDQES